MKFFTPSEWGSAFTSTYEAMRGEDRRNPELWVAHWPGGRHIFVGGFDESCRKLRDYEHYHGRIKGWRGIAYDYAVDLAGRAFLLRGTGRSAATSGDFDEDGVPNNAETDAVLFLIGPGQKPSSAMIATAQRLTGWSLRQWIGHRQAKGTVTECPGDDVMDYLPLFALPLYDDRGDIVSYDQAVVVPAGDDRRDRDDRWDEALGTAIAEWHRLALVEADDDGRLTSDGRTAEVGEPILIGATQGLDLPNSHVVAGGTAKATAMAVAKFLAEHPKRRKPGESLVV